MTLNLPKAMMQKDTWLSVMRALIEALPHMARVIEMKSPISMIASRHPRAKGVCLNARHYAFDVSAEALEDDPILLGQEIGRLYRHGYLFPFLAKNDVDPAGADALGPDLVIGCWLPSLSLIAERKVSLYIGHAFDRAPAEMSS